VNPVTLRLAANSVFTRFSANFYDQVKIIMFDCQFRHLGKFASGGVDVQYWNVILPKKGSAREPDEKIGILPHRPRHGNVFEGVISLSKNKYALVLGLIEMGAAQFGHDIICRK